LIELQVPSHCLKQLLATDGTTPIRVDTMAEIGVGLVVNTDLLSKSGGEAVSMNALEAL